MAKGEYVILADHDDTIPPQAFYEVAKAINKHPDCDVLYSDEDKLDMDGKALFDPHLKPDFNPDLLTSVNYICHLFVVKKELLDRVGGFRQEFDGAQDYDLMLRAYAAGGQFVHVPKVLYHWRCMKRLRRRTRRASATLTRRGSVRWKIIVFEKAGRRQ